MPELTNAKLKNLYLTQNPIKKIISMNKLVNLEVLILKETILEEFTCEDSLKNLRILDLSENMNVKILFI